MLASRVEATLAGAGHEVTLSAGLGAQPVAEARPDRRGRGRGRPRRGRRTGACRCSASTATPIPRRAGGPRPPGSTWWCRARGWPGSCPSWRAAPRGAPSRTLATSAKRTSRPVGAPVASRGCRDRPPSEATRPRSFALSNDCPGSTRMRAEQRPELRILFVAIESAGAREQVVEGVLRVPQLEPVAAHRGASSRGERAADRRAGAWCSHTATARGIAAPRSRRRGTRESGSPVAAASRPRRSRTRSTASTFPAASADTA